MIEDAAVILENSRGWRELLAAFEAGRNPQSLAAVVPSSMQELFVATYGKLLLGDSPVWKDGAHPDLIQAGKYLSPPSIDDCRTLPGELGLHPVVSTKRLAVIWSADKISLEAANSLLKLAEEPPAHGHVLFVLEEDNLIPTIKSRVWSIYIDLPEELAASNPYPSTAEDWAAWIEKGNKKTGSEIIYIEIESWIRYLTEKGDFVKAAEMESLIRLMEQKRLSVPMIQDLVFAVLKEGIPYGQIFGDIW